METLLEGGYDTRPQCVKLCKDKGPKCVCRVSQSGDPYTKYQNNCIQFTKAHHTITIALPCGLCICQLQKSMYVFYLPYRRIEVFRGMVGISKSFASLAGLPLLHSRNGTGLCLLPFIPWTTTHLVTSQALAICLELVRMQEIASERKGGARIGETLWICLNRRSSTEDLNAT